MHQATAAAKATLTIPRNHGMLTVTRSQLIEAMAGTGSRDQDVLFAAIEAATAGPRMVRRVGRAMVALGGLVCLTALGASVAVPLAVAGAGIWYASTRVLDRARDTYREYLSQVSVRSGAPRSGRPSPVTG